MNKETQQKLHCEKFFGIMVKRWKETHELTNEMELISQDVQQTYERTKLLNLPDIS